MPDVGLEELEAVGEQPRGGTNSYLGAAPTWLWGYLLQVHCESHTWHDNTSWGKLCDCHTA